MTAPDSSDRGSATVEFALFSLLLMVPLVYVLLTVFQIQRAAYGTAQAAREAARAFVTSTSGEQAHGRVQAAVALALGDQGLVARTARVVIVCSADPCLSPGATVTVSVVDEVPLPWVPTLLGRAAASIEVRATHRQTVDLYRPQRP